LCARKLFGEFGSVSFEFLFAFDAAEVVGFSVVSDFVFGSFFVQIYSTYRVSRHQFFLPLPNTWMTLISSLLIVVRLGAAFMIETLFFGAECSCG
jgi:hypothetical protein